MLAKLLFVFICVGFLLGQVGRIDVGNNIAVTLLDIATCIYVLYFFVLITLRKIVVSSIPFAKPFSIFVGICVLSLLINSIHYTLTQTLVAFLYIIRFAMYGLLFAALHQTLQSQRRFVIISLLSTGVGLLTGGLIQYFLYPNLRNLYYLGWDEHIYRLFSSFLDPNFMGAFLVLFFLFVVGIPTYHKKKSMWQFWFIRAVLPVCTLFTLLLTYSRSAFGMLFISCLVYFTLQKKPLYVLGIIVCLVGFYFLISPNTKIESTNLFRTTSSFARLTSSQEALSIFSKNPILGIGFDAYRYAQTRYGFSVKQNALYNHAASSTDNSFLFVLVTTGTIGFLAYLYLQWNILFSLWQRRYISPSSQVLLASFIGLYVDSFVINSLFYPSILVWIIMVLAVNDYT